MDQMMPLYEQVRQSLLSEIESGVLGEGDFLPPEPDLCQRFGVSRITLRRAVSELCREGRLIRQQGRGTLVAPQRVQQTLVSLSGFSELMDGLGRRSRHVVLKRDDGPNLPRIAAKLGASQLVRLERLLEVEGLTMTHETLHFDAVRFAALIPDVEAGGSFFEALGKHLGFHPGGAERTIDVTFPERKLARLLGIRGSQPCYRMEKLVTDGKGEPLSISHLVTPCHLVTYSLKV